MNALLVSAFLFVSAGTTVTSENPAYYLVALTEMTNDDGQNYLHPNVDTITLLNNAPNNKKACENRMALLVTQIELTTDRKEFYGQLRRQGFYGDLHTLLLCWTEREWTESLRHAQMCDDYGRDCDKMPF